MTDNTDGKTPRATPRRWMIWAPLIVFGALVALFFGRLQSPGDQQVASALVGKPLPPFALRAALPDRPGLSQADFARGKPRLLNVFASWCIPCAVEAPQLDQLKRQGVAIDGVAIRDRPEDIAAFLARNGDPFERIGADDVSAVQMALGSSGVPETFVVDGRGVIRYQHIGEIRPEHVPRILAELKEASE